MRVKSYLVCLFGAAALGALTLYLADVPEDERKEVGRLLALQRAECHKPEWQRNLRLDDPAVCLVEVGHP